MSAKKPIYITTTLPYVNANPHIGHALEMIQADVYARTHRILGHEVFFSTGVDEHGQKVFNKASKEGIEVKAYVDQYAKRFENLRDILGLSFDSFIRTTSPLHKKAAQEMWKRVYDSGDIYKKEYKGLYCVGCEAFIKEKDLKEGECPDHPGQVPQEVIEENYFFKFSKYQNELLEYLSRKDSVAPEFRRQDLISFASLGLEDISISRRAEKMPWGISVPGDDEHVMYVWFDALTNYLSTLGWPLSTGATEGDFTKFWERGFTIQCAGKDQMRFQSLLFQAMLFSAGIKRTDKIFYHGFITSGGVKMSKSIGNVIDPLVLQSEYGTDAFRYYLLRHIHPSEDSDFTEEKFKESYNAHLANGIGNLTSRIMKMAVEYDLEYEDLLSREEIWNHPENTAYVDALKNFEFNHALDIVWGLIQEADEYIAREEPFKVVKENPERAKKIVWNVLVKLHMVAVLLEPILPDTAEKIQSAIEKKEKPENLFVRK